MARAAVVKCPAFTGPTGANMRLSPLSMDQTLLSQGQNPQKKAWFGVLGRL